MFEPMLPDAPGLLSTRNGWPKDLPRCSASRRARMSVEPPGAQGTTRVTGCSGQAACAGAAIAPTTKAAQVRSLDRNRMALSLSLRNGSASAAHGIALHAARIGCRTQHQATLAIALAA